MKPKLYPFLFIVLTTILIISCKTASKLYQKGNYDEAVELAAKKLQKDPHDSKLLDIIQNSYKYAVEDHESRIRSNSESTNELKWEWMYNDYVSLQRMYDAIHKVPQVYEIIHPVDYSSYLITYGEKAGDVRYDRGVSLMQHAVDKQGYKSAYHELQIALGFQPGQRDIQQKMEEAYDQAVTNVVILPVEQTGYRYTSFNDYNSRNLDAELLRNLQYSSGNEFVKYYSSGDARGQDIRVDQVIDMRLTNVDIGRYHDSRSTRQVSKEIVVKETVYRPDSIVKEYAKVTAQITTTRRTMHSEAVLQVNIRDNDGRWLTSDHFTGNHNWSTEFSTYTGDARALSESDKQLINRRQDTAPFEDEIMRCMITEIQNNVFCRIRDYNNQF